MKGKSSNSLSSSANSSTQCISQIKTTNYKNTKKKSKAKFQDGDTALVKRTSNYKGVTRHKLTGRFEAHLWDKDTWNIHRTKKGRQVYLGAYDNEESAAHAYDLAALKYWGLAATLNFLVVLYEKDIEAMRNSTKEEYVAILRRKSSGFSSGVSKYRGVVKHHSGRWEARIGRDGKGYTYLGTYGSQEEAAIAYDKATIQRKGTGVVTNFDISTYAHLFEQGHPHEYDTFSQRNDEKQEDEKQNHNLVEKGKQDEEMNVLPPTLGCFNDINAHKDIMINFENVHGYEVEQLGSSCVNADEIFKLNVSDDGPHEKPGK